MYYFCALITYTKSFQNQTFSFVILSSVALALNSRKELFNLLSYSIHLFIPFFYHLITSTKFETFSETNSDVTKFIVKYIFKDNERFNKY